MRIPPEEEHWSISLYPDSRYKGAHLHCSNALRPAPVAAQDQRSFLCLAVSPASLVFCPWLLFPEFIKRKSVWASKHLPQLIQVLTCNLSYLTSFKFHLASFGKITILEKHITMLWQCCSNFSRKPATQRSALASHSSWFNPAVFATVCNCKVHTARYQ